jgi:hypothetical protein
MDRIDHHPQQIELSPDFIVSVWRTEGFCGQDDLSRHSLQQPWPPAAKNAGHHDVSEFGHHCGVDQNQVTTVQAQALRVVGPKLQVTDVMGFRLQKPVEVSWHTVHLYSIIAKINVSSTKTAWYGKTYRAENPKSQVKSRA